METPEEVTGEAGHENSDNGEEEGKHKFIVQNGKIFFYHIYFSKVCYIHRDLLRVSVISGFHSVRWGGGAYHFLWLRLSSVGNYIKSPYFIKISCEIYDFHAWNNLIVI